MQAEDKTGGEGQDNGEDEATLDYAVDSSEVWAYCQGRVANLVLHDVIELKGGLAGDLADYMNAFLDSDTAITCVGPDAGADDSTEDDEHDSADGSGSAPTGRHGAEKKRRSSSKASRSADADLSQMAVTVRELAGSMRECITQWTPPTIPETFSGGQPPARDISAILEEINKLEKWLANAKNENKPADFIRNIEKALAKVNKDFEDAVG